MTDTSTAAIIFSIGCAEYSFLVLSGECGECGEGSDIPDSARFFPVVGGLIEIAAKAARQQHHGVVVCGEGTSVLWAEGKVDATIRLEQLWNEVAKSFEVDILCGYALSSFHNEEDEHAFQSICAEHSAVYSQ
jgi:hypothetical protein